MNLFDWRGTLRREPFRGSARARKARARVVAIVIGTALFMSIAPESSASNHVIKDIKDLAKTTLTHKQYKCHNEIIYRESRWDERAIGNIGGTKQAYGLYQLKIDSMRIAHPEVQFWKYWQYVAYRYGITEYDEPMYCAALHHLKTKGWQ